MGKICSHQFAFIIANHLRELAGINSQNTVKQRLKSHSLPIALGAAINMHISQCTIEGKIFEINFALKSCQTPTLFAFHPHGFKGFNIVGIIKDL